MDKDNVVKLLDLWTNALNKGESISKKKASRNAGGLEGRIKRTTGGPVIFDSETIAEQSVIQNSLCKELPQWADIIRSQPEIMDGYAWIRKDFIELYFRHFHIVVEKLHKIARQSVSV